MTEVKLGTNAERLIAKHVHDVAAHPEAYLRGPRIRLLEAYLAGIAVAFRAGHGRDPFCDSPWNSWAAFGLKEGYGHAGILAGLERAGDGPEAFRTFLALFNRWRAWARGRSCVAALEDARSAAQVRAFFRRKGARVPRGRLGARQFVVSTPARGGSPGRARRFDAAIFRSPAWLEDEADGMDNRVAIAILDGAAP